MDPIIDFLKREGPQLSTAITLHLCHTLGISEVAARQRVSRAKLPVKRLGLITFPRKARFLYLEQQFASPYYWENLKAALSENKTAYGYALVALLSRGGVCLEKHFPIICGAPLRQKGHLSADIVLERLVQAGLLKRRQHEGFDLISLAQNEVVFELAVEDMLGRLMAETALLGAIQTWLQKLNMVSYNSVKIRNDAVLPMVATYAWDLTAPSYLSPLLGAKKPEGVNPGFWVCDVYLGHLTVDGAEVFLRKCQTFRALRTVAPTMQMIVADSYSVPAFQLLKRNGVIVATVQSLFGLGTAEALKRTAAAITASLHRAVDVDELAEVMKQLQEHQGEMGNIRGVFFELLVRDVVKTNSTGSPAIQTGFVARIKKDDEAEVDVLVHNPSRGVRFIETKAHNPQYPLADEEVDRWIDHNIKKVFSYSQAHPEWKKEKLTFELWSTAPLSVNALSKISAFQTKNKRRFTVVVLQKNEILAEFRETKDKRLINVLKNYFLNKRKKLK